MQGVGFRPFIYRLAIRHNISGWVENRNDGVLIHAEGSERALQDMIGRIIPEAPLASQIRSIDIGEASFEGHNGFIISKSMDVGEEITEVSPDIAVCDDCLRDMREQPHRLLYPFTNCTHCGPRFTIIRDLPYDRHHTTMEPFRMCPVCRKEYEDIFDRRFHAQPVACNTCGPQYTLIEQGEIIAGTSEIVSRAAGIINAGRILGVKGLGGFHLACDARDARAVETLRNRKVRDGKPFAVMFRDLERLKEFLCCGPGEEAALLSWRRPIVILKNKPGGPGLAREVSAGFHTTGAMLPYMPIHYLLFQELKTPVIVLTSGNYSDEPITTRNEDAMTSLVRITDAMLLYNREIHNRTDDSVTFLSGDKLRLIRRSRGFVPAPVELPFQAEGIFSSGAELVNCFCIGKGRQAFLSQHIGDLKNLETLEFYKESISLFVRILRAGITHLVCDLHPDYLSTRFCEEWAGKENLPLHRVQHHHAHIASCMAEKGLSGRVIGISMDGVGFGDDGHIWGGEVMVCDYLMYDRIAHLDYIPQPGGDKATEEPWRMAVAYLIKVFGNEFRTLRLPFLDMVDSLEVDTVVAALGKNINCPLTSSTGRLFDAAAALTGVCVRSGFHAEAPMRLEDIIDPDEKGSYKFDIGKTIATDGIIRGIVDDLLSGTGIPRIATRFHRTMAGIILESARLARSMTGLDTVVLSGGTFQNRFLLDLGERTLGEDGFKVYSHHDTPSNDGGIALGQLAIAAARRSANFNV